MRIALVASELLGAYKNGGIGTATTHLALFLAGEGHRVRLVYTGANPIDYASPWVRRCQAAGIVLTALDTRSAPIYPIWLRESCVVYDYLACQELDLVIFQDWEGSGFSSVVAKRAGLAFAATRLMVIAHGPTAWLLDANRETTQSLRTLAHLHVEGTVFAWADGVLCPSRHMADWLARHGHAMQAPPTAIPLYLWSDEGDGRAPRGAALDRVETFAFFGRLETRKGVDLFLDAILSDRLAARHFNVVFVGKPASHSRERVLEVIAARRPALLPHVSFRSDFDSDEAQRFLCDKHCLAVIPSLIDNAPCVISECLRRTIPFLSTRVGGIPELIDEADRDRVLVEPHPDALAQLMADVLHRPFRPARPAYAREDVALRWRGFIEALAPVGPAAPSPPTVRPPAAERVAVVVTHYDRPRFLAQALESLAVQTKSDFDLVLVDDGSTLPEAKTLLDAVEARAWPFRLRVVRRENGYLGAARNSGIEATDAERLVFLDDDNLAFPTMVETLDAALSRCAADIVTCQMAIFREPEGPADPATLFGAERWGFPAGSLELGLSINCFGDATGIYRRSVFERVGRFHEWRGVGCEDWHLHARAALAGLAVVSLPVPLFWYRRLDSGMLLSTDMFANRRIIRDAYRAALPPGLARLADLGVRHDSVI